MGELEKQTVSGVKWLVFSGFFEKTISVATTIVLARVLSPSIFGLYSLAFIAINALSLFNSLGIDAALVRKQDGIDKASNTAFLIIPFLGLSLFILLTILAPFVGKFLNNQEVISVIRALALIFVFSCLGKVPAVLLEKRMKFRQISIIEVTAALMYSAVALILIQMKIGIWTLVVAYLVKTIYQNSMYWFFSKWRPHFQFDKKIALEMFHFGKYIFLGSFVWFLKMNLDNLLVGKLLGVTALGLYGIAFSMGNYISDYIGTKVFKVTYPAYSKMQSDRDALRNAYLKVLKNLSLIIFPYGIGLIVLGGECIRFIYGERWVGAETLLKILALAGIFNALPGSLGNIFLVRGKPKFGLWITSFQVLVFFIFIAPMARLFGMEGVGVVVVFSSFSACTIIFFLGMKILNIRLTQIMDAIRTALFSSIVMAMIVLLLKYFQTGHFLSAPNRLDFVILFPSSFLAYFLCVYLSDRSALRDIRSLIFSQRPRT